MTEKIMPQIKEVAADESAGFLDDVSSPLYIMIHRATEPARGVVVIVPPFAEEKKAAQRALVEAARAFAGGGFDVLRFDFRGTGDSGDEFSECDVAMWREDLRAVLVQARAMAGERPLHVVGLRFGATLAWLAADEDLQIDSLVLWEPIISGATYMRQNRQRSQIRSQLTAREESAKAEPVVQDGSTLAKAELPKNDAGAEQFAAFDFDGFLVSSRLHRDIVGIDLLRAPVPAVQRVLLLQISGSKNIRKPLQDLQTRVAESGIEPESDNATVEAFWSAIGLVDTANVRERTLQWLDAQSTPSSIKPVPSETENKRLVTTALIQDAPAVIAESLSFMSGEQRVHGVLYRPDTPVQRAVLLLHGWSGYRIGPGHLLTEAARALAAAGYAAYSFDFRGRGESEWEVGQASLNSMIRDACRAVPVVLERTGAEKVTLLGLCSGAEVALGAGLFDSRIDSLALWSAPIFSGAFTTSRQLRRGRESAKKYMQKLFYPETWAKLVTGRLNFKMIARALSGGRSNEDAAVVDKAPDTAGQMKEFEAFRGRLLFIYASNDPETVPSRDFYREFVERTNMPHQFYEVAGANHNYYSMAWKQELIETTLAWLKAG
jgi:alpha-beta hydrolase superfamily lysophospholipase